MWVIYHGYKATSAPLMAAILHRYFYPSIVGSDKKKRCQFVIPRNVLKNTFITGGNRLFLIAMLVG